MTARRLVVLIALFAATAHADDRRDADALFAEGRALLDAGNAQAACDKFSQVIALDPEAAGTMLNLGLCNKQLGRLKTALYWFRKAQTRANETNAPAYETSARENAVALAAQVPTLKITFSSTPPPNVKVKLDGEIVKPDDYHHVELDPGHHVLDASAPGMRLFHRELEAAATGEQAIAIDIVAGDNVIVIDRGQTRRRIGIGLGAGGVALAAIGTDVVLTAVSRYGDCASDGKIKSPLPASCPQPTDPRGYANHQHDVARYLGTPLVVGGALAIATGAVLFFTAPSRERIDQVVIRPIASPDSIGIAVGGGF